MNSDLIITQTKNWINDVVIGCNFCPFAAREVKRNSIHYAVVEEKEQKSILQFVLSTLQKMDSDAAVETSLIILPNGFTSFNDYLDLLHAVEKLVKKNKYEGVYQVASFHPHYLFAGSSEADAANYTNRSPYPMLHILREESVSRAIDSHPDTSKIPETNIAFANEKGLAYMKALASGKK